MMVLFYILSKFLKIFRNIYLCRQTLTWKWFSRLKIRAFLVQYTSMMMHRAKTTNDVLYICNLNAVKFKVMSNLWRSMNFFGFLGFFFLIIYFSFKVYVFSFFKNWYSNISISCSVLKINDQCVKVTRFPPILTSK